MKFFTIKKCLQYYLPVALSLFMLVTIERTVTTDGGYDKLFGLPFPYISNSYAFSMSYDVYILPMFLNLLFYFALTFTLFKILEKVGLVLKTHWTLVSLGIIISSFWLVAFYFTNMDSFFSFKNQTEYRTINKKLTIGFKP